jgi:hypothetical protein
MYPHPAQQLKKSVAFLMTRLRKKSENNPIHNSLKQKEISKLNEQSQRPMKELYN